MIAIVFHESGHYIGYRLFGFNDVRLHYDRVTYDVSDQMLQKLLRGNLDAASELYPLWQVAIGNALGPLFTIVAILICCIILFWVQLYCLIENKKCV